MKNRVLAKRGLIPEPRPLRKAAWTLATDKVAWPCRVDMNLTIPKVLLYTRSLSLVLGSLGLHGVRRLRQQDPTRRNPKRKGGVRTMFSDVRILQRDVTFSDDVRVLAFGPHIVDQHLDDLLHGRHLLCRHLLCRHLLLAGLCDADQEEEECKNTPRHC